MILKVLLILGLILAVYFIFFKKNAPLTAERRGKKEHKDDNDTMVECTKCSVYVSIDEAIVSSGKYYCSQECLKA